MIEFLSVSYKNFLSTGNTPIEVVLNTHPFTLIDGTNGAGKSLLQNSISFAIFGKSQRGINKPQYVNSINKKDCLVELKFRRSNEPETIYTIRRGVKPNKFEIYKNKALLNQDSSVRDYQKYLEQEILGFNYTVFNQIVFLSSKSYIPFMKLTTAQRREVIEELLSIDIFSKLKVVLKEKIDSSKQKLDDLTTSCSQLKFKLQSHRDYMKVLEEQSNADVSRLKKELNSKTDEQLSIQTQIRKKESDLIELTTSLQESIDNSSGSPQIAPEINPDNIQTKEKDLHRNFIQCETSLKSIRKSLEFFTKTDKCPTCNQFIDSIQKDKNIKKLQKEQENVESSLDILNKVQELFDKKQKEFTEINEKLRLIKTDISQLEYQYDQLTQEKDSISEQIAKNKQKTSLDEYRTKEKEYVDLYETLLEKKAAEQEWQYTYLTRMSDLLKDNGIKAQMIRQYIPLINRLLNHYLAKMNFFVSFHFDENFNETILSRHRDSFSYESFSSGQQSRIDLALLFVWREIAKKRNSAACNLLFLDEVFDSSLDKVGVEDLITILTENSEPNKENVYVITHSDEIKQGAELFSRKIHVSKPKNFTEIQMVDEIL